MQPKISVIVPIYNVEPYLRRCLDSLVNQTLRDIEIICINDCSPDNSLSVIKEYAEKDEIVKIIDFEKNLGVSVARNSGMKIAKGEYIGFCDPDDYVDLDFYEKLYVLAKNKNADIAKAARKRMDVGSNTEFIENLNERVLKHKGYFTYQYTTAIFRNEMLKKHKVKFPVEIITNQDVCFLVHAVIAAKNVYLLNNAFYHYVRRDNSSNSVTYSSHKMYSVLKSYSLILNSVNKAIEKDKHYSNIYTRFFHALFTLLERNSEDNSLKLVAKIAIKYFHKCKYQQRLDLPKLVAKALKEKERKELPSLLIEWKKYGFYPEINITGSILQNRRLYIWGTGADGSKVQLQCRKNNWKISAFLDSNKDVKVFNEYKVRRPESLLSSSKRNFFIIISSRKYASEIAKVCRDAGLKIGINFWRPN